MVYACSFLLSQFYEKVTQLAGSKNKNSYIINYFLNNVLLQIYFITIAHPYIIHIFELELLQNCPQIR
jgi:hypothetical protein